MPSLPETCRSADARPHYSPTAIFGKRRRLHLSIAHTLTLGIPLLFLASLLTSLWFAFDAAWRNTFELERDLAELTVEAAIREVDTHLGAAQEQVEFLDAGFAAGPLGPFVLRGRDEPLEVYRLQLLVGERPS